MSRRHDKNSIKLLSWLSAIRNERAADPSVREGRVGGWRQADLAPRGAQRRSPSQRSRAEVSVVV